MLLLPPKFNESCIWINFFVSLILHKFTNQSLNKMDLQHTYNAEEFLGIVKTLTPKDKETLKNTLLLDEAEFERLVKEDFAKYEATFRALA